jgi:hypothetical protein
VASLVVDLFQTIEVDVDEPAVGVHAPNEFEHLFGADQEAAAIVESGQFVGEGEAQDLGFHLLAQDGFGAQLLVGGLQLLGTLRTRSSSSCKMRTFSMATAVESASACRILNSRVWAYDLSPVVADGSDRILGTDGNHGQAAHEGGAIGFDRDARSLGRYWGWRIDGCS